MMKDENMEELAKKIAEQAKKEKKIIKLHCHPDAIKASIKELKEMTDEEGLRFLFEDISTLVEWALKRLPIVPPPTEKGSESVS